MPVNETTRFTISDGQVTNIIEYTLVKPPPPIPTLSDWGLVVLTLLVLTTAALVIRRYPCRPTA